VAGYVLFPGKIPSEALDAEKGNYYYVESNNKIGIGAFPLRPDASEQALYEQIKKWIDEDDGRQMLLDMTIPQKGLQYIDDRGGRGPYFLSSIDAQVNEDIVALENGKATTFITGYTTILAGIDFRRIKYFAPVIDHEVRGYYKVESFDIIDAGKILEEHREKKEVKLYKGYDKPFRIQLSISSYLPIAVPFTYGIDRNAARGIAMTAKEFKDYVDKHKK
jgi:hypothetical protein